MESPAPASVEPAEPTRPSLRPTHLQSVDLSPGRNLRHDLPAGLVVFLVALPLCLGVALASGAPLLSGLVAGVLGGILVPLVSRSALSVSGPAAGLAAIVSTGIESLGGFGAVCAATALAGLLQLVLGSLRAGVIASFMPSAVIRGMLAAIGILLVLKQIPHAIGYDHEAFESDSFVVEGEGNTFTLLFHALTSLEWGAVAISAVSLAILVAYDHTPFLRKLGWLPGPLVVVVVGTAMNLAFEHAVPALALGAQHLVEIPASGRPADLLAGLTPAPLAHFADGKVWMFGLTIAIVASLETLLSLDAIDKLDPFRRRSDPNRELVAQGLANAVSGSLGGLPVTSVIVRSSANVNAGGRTRVATFTHGVLILVAVVFLGTVLNHVPLATLATILVVTGAKLAKPSTFRAMFALGQRHFVPFVVTIVAIVGTDLLRGIVVGLVVGVAFTVRESMSGAFVVEEEQEGVRRIRFLKDIHFFHKPSLLEVLDRTPAQTLVIVDRGASDFVEHDVVEAICDFRSVAGSRGVEVVLVGIEPVEPVGAH